MVDELAQRRDRGKGGERRFDTSLAELRGFGLRRPRPLGEMSVECFLQMGQPDHHGHRELVGQVLFVEVVSAAQNVARGDLVESSLRVFSFANLRVECARFARDEQRVAECTTKARHIAKQDDCADGTSELSIAEPSAALGLGRFPARESTHACARPVRIGSGSATATDDAYATEAVAFEHSHLLVGAFFRR